MSELIAGVVGAITGAIAGGIISYLLTQQQFHAQNKTRELDKIMDVLGLILRDRSRPVDRASYLELEDSWEVASKRFRLAFTDKSGREIRSLVGTYLREPDEATSSEKALEYKTVVKLENLRRETIIQLEKITHRLV